MNTASGTAAWPTIVALVQFELRLHRRDFMAWLGFLVFLLLTFGYASSGVIVLVGDLGDTPRTAPWALAQAMAGVTAFGQVITAMTAATTVLRDVGTRTQDIILATPMSWRTYLLGRFVGTLAVLAAIYAAIPLGLLAGDFAAAGAGGLAGSLEGLQSLAHPLLLLVLPNVLLVAAAFFAAGALSGGFTVILFVGLGLIALWQTGLSLVAAGVAWGAMIDPFGNAALTWSTAAWTDAMRATLALPVDQTLLANRALWLGVSGAVLGATLRWWRPRIAAGARAVSPAASTAAPAASPPAPLRGATWPALWAAELRFGWRWVLRERGFAALLALALLNAAANGWRVADDPTALLRALEFHARLFGILIATIYAGELVWRDRDVRADEMLRALPASPGLRLVARASGVMLALQALPVALVAMALLLPLLQGSAPAPLCAARWLLGVSAPMFAGLLAVSLAVHATVRHKTAAHLLIISAWVGAIALGATPLARLWQVWGSCALP